MTRWLLLGTGVETGELVEDFARFQPCGDAGVGVTGSTGADELREGDLRRSIDGRGTIADSRSSTRSAMAIIWLAIDSKAFVTCTIAAITRQQSRPSAVSAYVRRFPRARGSGSLKI